MMTYKEFITWLNDCPTHKWDITAYEDSFVVVSFPIQQEENDNDE